MRHPYDGSNIPPMLGPSCPADEFAPASKLVDRANRIAAGFSDAGKAYDHWQATPPAGYIEPTAEEAERRRARGVTDVIHACTHGQKIERTIEGERRLIAAFDAELPVRRALIEPAEEIARHYEAASEKLSRSHAALTDEFARKIAANDFPDEVPRSPSVCGPVRAEYSRWQDARTRADSARSWCHANRRAVELIEHYREESAKKLAGAEKRLRKLS